MHERDHYSATPGVPPVTLTEEPLGTSGELSPGPDHLRPEVPEERRELVRMGYLDDQPDGEPEPSILGPPESTERTLGDMFNLDISGAAGDWPPWEF